jgi:hypothetical protein
LEECDRKRYFDISDLAPEMESVKQDQEFALNFTYYDTSGSIIEFVRELPKRLREKWAFKSDSYNMKKYITGSILIVNEIPARYCTCEE